MEPDETVTNPEPVAEEAAPETEVTTEETEGLEQEQLETPAPEDDLEDMEFEGKSFKAPKGLKSAMMMHADYTQKTQAIAAEKAQAKALVERTQAFAKDVGRLSVIDEQLAQYSKVDWQAYSASNPQEAQSAYFQYQQLRDNRSHLAGEIERRAREQEAAAEHEFANQRSQTLASLSKPDPSVGWTGKITPELKQELDTFAYSLGYTDEALSRANANDVKTLNLAMLGQKYLKQQRALAKQKPQEAKPIPQVTKGRGNVIQGLDDRLSPEEWVKRRNKQIEARG